jgi:hypothetical protein
MIHKKKTGGIGRIIALVTLMTAGAGGVFAQAAPPPPSQEEAPKAVTHKHSAGDMLLGLNWAFFGMMMNENPVTAFSDVYDSFKLGDPAHDGSGWSMNASVDLPQFFATLRLLSLGVSYEYYVFHWMTVGTGLGFSPEVNTATKGGRSSIVVTGEMNEDDAKQAAVDEILSLVHIQAGLFLTIPFNVHFNIPKVEWLYGGLGLEIHVPISDLGLDSLLPADIIKYLPGGSIKGETFVSLPIDIGFDLCRVKKNGKPALGRLFFRIEPEFLSGGFVSVPVSLVWQSKLWKLASVPIKGAK